MLTDQNWPPASQALTLAAFEEVLQTHPQFANGPGTMVWKINGEKISVLGWGRAILLQMAHPAIASGVSQHSQFEKDPLKRFHGTLDTMLKMSFGTPQEAWQAAHKIDTIHARINGTIDATNQRYSAREPALLKWVHATFTDSALRIYDLFVEPLTLAQKDKYIQQASLTAPLLGAPIGYFPNDYAELNVYMAQMLNSDTLQVGDNALKIARALTKGLLNLPITDFGIQKYGTLPTIGMLPTKLRQAYGYEWTRLDALKLKSAAWTYRHLHPTIPLGLRRWEFANQ